MPTLEYLDTLRGCKAPGSMGIPVWILISQGYHVRECKVSIRVKADLVLANLLDCNFN